MLPERDPHARKAALLIANSARVRNIAMLLTIVIAAATAASTQQK